MGQLLHTYDLPNVDYVVTGTYADGTAILAMDTTLSGASHKLQISLNIISVWLRDWKIKG